MKAIEVTGRIDKKGKLLLDKPLKLKDKSVKIIILMEEEEEEEQSWLSAVAKNPAFDFLKDEKEDIYSLSDGKPLDDSV